MSTANRNDQTQSPADSIRTFIAQTMLFNNKGYPYPDTASFLEEGIIDSMNVMELILFVETTFGIEVGDEEMVPDNFDSVSKIVDFIQRKRA